MHWVYYENLKPIHYCTYDIYWKLDKILQSLFLILLLKVLIISTTNNSLVKQTKPKIHSKIFDSENMKICHAFLKSTEKE